MNYMTPFISLLNEMSPYLLLGFLIAGILKVFVPKEKYIRYLAQPDFRSVFGAALAGIPLPLCSCGVIPTGMGLRKEGASKGATAAFLISTPQTGVDSIAATCSMMGLPFALLRPLAAFVTSLFGGFFVNRFDKSVSVAGNLPTEAVSEYTGKNKVVQALHYSFVEMIQDIGKWLLIGIFAAGLIAVFVPDDFFTANLNNPLLNMLIVLLISIPMYTCATGSIPLAAVLMMKGLSPGAALVFLMAGPATSFATMTVVGKVLGKKTLAVYMASIVGGAIVFGLLLDYLLPASWFGVEKMNHNLMHAHSHEAFSWFNSSCSILLVGLIIHAF
ncbi:MAG: permease, partial [Prevotella sp.]|nr:permease [Prevotella sp.]